MLPNTILIDLLSRIPTIFGSCLTIPDSKTPSGNSSKPVLSLQIFCARILFLVLNFSAASERWSMKVNDILIVTPRYFGVGLHARSCPLNITFGAYCACLLQRWKQVDSIFQMWNFSHHVVKCSSIFQNPTQTTEPELTIVIAKNVFLAHYEWTSKQSFHLGINIQSDLFETKHITSRL